MNVRDEASLALPILLCGILGGMVGGLNCCCWLVPGVTSLMCVRWARNLRGDGRPLMGVGFMASLISAGLVATWGTAVFLYLNDPARMGESQAMVEELLGSGGLEELPLGAMALGIGGLGFVFALSVGLVGAAVGSIGNRRARAPMSSAGAGSMSATRFLDPTARPPGPPAPMPVAPQAASVGAPVPPVPVVPR